MGAPDLDLSIEFCIEFRLEYFQNIARRESIDESYCFDHNAIYFLAGNLTDLLQGNTRSANVGQLRRTPSHTRPRLFTGATFGLTQSMSPDATENLSSDRWLEDWADGTRTAM